MGFGLIHRPETISAEPAVQSDNPGLITHINEAYGFFQSKTPGRPDPASIDSQLQIWNSSNDPVAIKGLDYEPTESTTVQVVLLAEPINTAELLDEPQAEAPAETVQKPNLITRDIIYKPTEPSIEPQASEPEETYESKISPEPRIDKIRATAETVAFGGLVALASARRLPRQGVSQIANKASELHTKANTQVMNGLNAAREKVEYALSSPELRSNRHAAGIALGALAVAGAAYLTYKGMPLVTGHHRLQEAQQAVPSKVPTHPAEAIHHTAVPKSLETKTTLQQLISAPKIKSEHAQKAINKIHHINSNLKTTQETLKYHGDTIWAHGQQKLHTALGRNPSTEQVRSYVSHVLKANHLSWADARHMRIGQHFKMPNILRQK